MLSPAGQHLELNQLVGADQSVVGLRSSLRDKVFDVGLHPGDETDLLFTPVFKQRVVVIPTGGWRRKAEGGLIPIYHPCNSQP